MQGEMRLSHKAICKAVQDYLQMMYFQRSDLLVYVTSVSQDEKNPEVFVVDFEEDEEEEEEEKAGDE